MAKTLAPIPLVLVFAALTAPLAYAQTTPPGRPATARALLAAMGAERQFIQGLEASLPAQKQAAPQLPTVFWDRLLARAKSAAPTFLDSLAPIYAKSFTEPELQELLKFFGSRIGTRFATAQPELLQATQQLGYRWGVRLGSDVAKELADEGLLKP